MQYINDTLGDIQKQTCVCVCVSDVSVLPDMSANTVSWIITTVRTTSVTMELSALTPSMDTPVFVLRDTGKI